MGAEDLLSKFFFLLGVEVGLSLFKNVDSLQKDFLVWREHSLFFIQLMGSFDEEGHHALMTSLKSSIGLLKLGCVKGHFHQ